MEKTPAYIVYIVVASAAVVGFLVFITIDILLLLRYRNIKHKNKVLEMETQYEQELQNAKLEVATQLMKDISYELHDNIMANLTMGILGLNMEKSKEPNPKADEMLELITESINDIRQLSHFLNGDFADKFDLLSTLQRMKESLDRSGIISAEFTLDELPKRFVKTREILLLRVIQELVNNSAKHSRASVLTLNLQNEGQMIRLEYSDNGIGMDADGETISGLGMGSIARRLDMLRANWELFTSPGNGFRIVAKIPVQIK